MLLLLNLSTNYLVIFNIFPDIISSGSVEFEFEKNPLFFGPNVIYAKYSLFVS